MSGYDSEGFKMCSQSGGKLRADVEGEHQEVEYKAKNYINRAGTIGYAEIEPEGEGPAGSIFLSKTAVGKVLTMPGPETGPTTIPVEGFHAIMMAKEGCSVEETYDAHKQALEKAPPLADEAWLREELPMLPQKAVDVMLKIFEAMVKVMEGVMEDMGQAVGQVMEGVGEGMAKAMGDTMEGMMEAMPEEAVEDGPKRTCPGCGKEVQDTDKTCSGCGKELE